MGWGVECGLSVLEGQTITKITGGDKYDQEMIFECADGSKYRMCHYQSCCETVEVEDVCGDLNDLIDSPVLKASAETSNDDEAMFGTALWTFYKIDTLKGGVTIRWHGSSNGYYSEEVTFEKVA